MSYWEERYLQGGKSGTKGKSARQDLERYRWRANIINRVAQAYKVESVLDIGAGDGLQARLFDLPGYLGTDISPTAVALATERCPDKEFIPYDPGVEPRDMHLSLSVMFHLVEQQDYEDHLKLLFSAEKVAVVYASDYDKRGFSHVLHRRWTPDVPEGWRLVEVNPERRGVNTTTVWERE